MANGCLIRIHLCTCTRSSPISLVRCPYSNFASLLIACSVATPLSLVLDLFLEPKQHVIFEGVQSNIPVGLLEPEQSKAVEMPVAFMTSGRFDAVAEVKVLGQSHDRSKVGQGNLRIAVDVDSI